MHDDLVAEDEVPSRAVVACLHADIARTLLHREREGLEDGLIDVLRGECLLASYAMEVHAVVTQEDLYITGHVDPLDALLHELGEDMAELRHGTEVDRHVHR